MIIPVNATNAIPTEPYMVACAVCREECPEDEAQRFDEPGVPGPMCPECAEVEAKYQLTVCRKHGGCCDC